MDMLDLHDVPRVALGSVRGSTGVTDNGGTRVDDGRDDWQNPTGRRARRPHGAH